MSCLKKYKSRKYLGEGNPAYSKIETKCDECGKIIYKQKARFKKYNWHFCSDKCKNKFSKRGYFTIKTPIMIPCEICGEIVFKKETWLNRIKHTFCSSECYGKWLSKNIQGENNPSFNSEKCICKNCGEEFWKCKSSINLGEGIFCSRKCYLEYKGETEIEKKIRMELEKRDIVFEQEKIIKCGAKVYYADFLISPNLIVECDGEYWHSLPITIKRDKHRDACLSKNGFSILRLPEKKINTDLNSCIKEILCRI